MSEKARNHEVISTTRHEAAKVHIKHEKAEVPKHDAREQAQHARETIEQNVNKQNPLDRLKAEEKAAERPQQQSFVNSELKKITLRHELQQIRRRLPAPQRALSKVIHQPVVRVVSEAAGNTVSRPSGLLGGGIVALTGTTLYLFLANHVGFKYNYGVFLLLFAIGFALGLILELIVYAATSSRRKAND